MEKQKIISHTHLQVLTETISQDYFECLPFIETKFIHSATFNTRLRTTAGRYLILEGNIELNPHYYLKYGQRELTNVIKHELVHYHLHQMGLPYKHKNKEFKELADLVEAPKYAKPMVKYKYIYTCSNCDTLFYRVKKVNTVKYRCGRCKGSLILKES